MRLQPFACERDRNPPGVGVPFDIDAADIREPLRDSLAQRKAIGEVFEIAGRRHHHGERRSADNDLYWRLDCDRARERLPYRAGVVGKGPRFDIDRVRPLTRPHRRAPSRCGEG